MAYSDYKIENFEPIGSGGNANVYLAKNVKTERMVALKELKTGGRFFEEKKDRFCIETRLVKRIQDSVKGIIPIFDAGLPDEKNKKKYWYAMPIEAFERVKKQEASVSQRNNVNAKTLLDLGKDYSEAVDEFLKSDNSSYITDRIFGVACLRGTDIYMSALRHNITDHRIKAERYKRTALLLREYADEVYEKQKYKECDSKQVNEWSAKEFILYVFSAVCYEQAKECGDTSSEKRMK